MFDIKNFHSSIKLLWETIRFTKHYISITNKHIEATFHARKSLLYHNDERRVTKGESNFHVTTSAFNGLEVCELIADFILSLLSKHINKDHIGLYSDNSLAIFKNTSGPKAEKLKKKFQKLFKEKDLDVVVQYNLKNYLDITLNLNDGSYRPYRKSKEETIYIHVHSDNPSSITKEIPRSIKKRFSILSSSKKIFRSQPFTMKNT